MMEQLSQIGRTWAFSLTQASLQIAVLILLVGVASLILRNSSPAIRYTLWCFVLLRLLLPTGLHIPSVISTAQASAASASSTAPAPTASQQITKQERRKPRRSKAELAAWRKRVAQERERAERDRRNMAILGAAWCGVSATLLGIVLLRVFLLRRRISRWPLVIDSRFKELMGECCRDMGIRHAVQVRSTPDSEAQAPAVAALFKPVIIIPDAMVKEWDREDLRPILLHELAHVRRRDMAINWLQIVLQSVYFFHPLVWFANWKIRALREEACDDLTIEKLGGSRAHYSASLVRAIELVNSNSRMCGSLSLYRRTSDLGKRLRRVLRDGYTPRPQSNPVTLCKAVSLGLACVVLSGMVPSRPVPSQKPLHSCYKRYSHCEKRARKSVAPERSIRNSSEKECGKADCHRARC